MKPEIGCTVRRHWETFILLSWRRDRIGQRVFKLKRPDGSIVEEWQCEDIHHDRKCPRCHPTAPAQPIL